MSYEIRQAYLDRAAKAAADLTIKLKEAAFEREDLPIATEPLLKFLNLIGEIRSPADARSIKSAVKEAREVFLDAYHQNLGDDGHPELLQVHNLLQALITELTFITDTDDADWPAAGPTAEDGVADTVPRADYLDEVQEQQSEYSELNEKARQLVKDWALVGMSVTAPFIMANPTNPAMWAAGVGMVSLHLDAHLNRDRLSRGWLDYLSTALHAGLEGLREAVAAARRLANQVSDALARAWDASDAVVERGSRAIAKTRGFVRRIFRRRGGGDTPDPWPPGKVFRDLDEPWCPEMVVIPAGEFLMGSSKKEVGHRDSESPQVDVRVAKFALGTCAVTFAEYDAFCEATGREKPKDRDRDSGDQPAINVSWHGAQDYCAWLSERTGAAYRLPSEAEWEYACRAGSTGPFWWGDTITPGEANYDGSFAYNNGETGEYRQRTLPVRSFSPNGFGLYQVHGNVLEWCEDDWQGSHEGAASDGTARVFDQDRKIQSKVVCNGSWSRFPRNCRSAFRFNDEPGDQISGIGFRVARTLTS